MSNPTTTDEIVAARIRKYEAEIGDPTRPGEKCPCTKCETARQIVSELQYIQMAARNLAPRPLGDHSLVMALQAAISRRDWHGAEQAANRIRDDKQIVWPSHSSGQRTP